MDADTRHQLRQNELAEALARLRDFTDKRTVAWVAVILIIALSYAGYKLWGWRERVGITASYRTLTSLNATDASLGEAPLTQLRQLIADNQQPGLVALSRLQLAHGLEARGLQADDAARLAEAETQYQAILDMPDAPEHVKAAASYRLGLLYETKRDFAKARERYASLNDNPRFDGSPFTELAVSRLDQLDDLAISVKFEPGIRPLPTTQPASQPAGKVRLAGPAADRVTISPVATSPPAVKKDQTDRETTNVAPPSESSEPQQP